MARTHRSPDGIYASTGAVNQVGGKLPIYVCNDCGRDVVWAESRKTGRKYLANVSRGYSGARFYIAANLHRCDAPGFVNGKYDSSIASDIENAEAYQAFVQAESDEFNARWVGFKNEYAATEREQEEAAFMAGLE